MSFILIPKNGEELQINGWHWRPTLELLLHEKLIDEESHARMGENGCGGEVDAETALRIAAFLESRLAGMKEERIKADLTVTDQPKKQVIFGPEGIAADVDLSDLYSASYEWLLMFKEFAAKSGGFRVS